MADGSSKEAEDVMLPVGKAAVDQMIRQNSHLFSDSQCKVCSAVLISESQKLAHYQSRKHANKVKRYRAIRDDDDEAPVAKKLKVDTTTTSNNDEEDRNKCCPLCNMTFTSPVVAQSHYQGKTHAKNLKLKLGAAAAVSQPLSKKSMAQDDSLTHQEFVGSSDPDKFCSLCHATFNNPLMAKQHYVGKKHKKQETKVKLMQQFGQTAAEAITGYPCTTCKIVLNSIEQYRAHISGSKHKNHMKSGMPAGMGAPPRPQKNYYVQEAQQGGYSYYSHDLCV
ncbi:zinc finger protein 346 isoform X1 [Latimeria chalumnae]|uniref:zinc finger protein 346 isoform X1 n=3 Tax=Latimeria chalumnae TaxID=7897 RepID=UPI00313B571B